MLVGSQVDHGCSGVQGVVEGRVFFKAPMWVQRVFSDDGEMLIFSVIDHYCHQFFCAE